MLNPNFLDKKLLKLQCIWVVVLLQLSLAHVDASITWATLSWSGLQIKSHHDGDRYDLLWRWELEYLAETSVLDFI